MAEKAILYESDRSADGGGPPLGGLTYFIVFCLICSHTLRVDLRDMAMRLFF